MSDKSTQPTNQMDVVLRQLRNQYYISIGHNNAAFEAAFTACMNLLGEADGQLKDAEAQITSLERTIMDLKKVKTKGKTS